MRQALVTQPKRMRAHKSLRRRNSARVIEKSAAPVESAEDAGLYVRPDGWYWAAADRHQEFGPFSSRPQALADRGRFDQRDIDDIDTVQDIERGVGLLDWLDVETGMPFDGESPPLLGER
jgi:hypothetical protein